MLSPRLAELHRDAFVIDDAGASTVDIAAHRGDSTSTNSISTWTRRRRPHRRSHQTSRRPARTASGSS
jgi:hypothetical protein